MIPLKMVIESLDITEAEIRQWVAAEWVVPAEEKSFVFSEMEVARIRLIRDLMRDLAVEQETVPLVLSLLDQVYDLRHRLRCLAAAVQEQPTDVRKEVRRLVKRHLEGG